MEELLGRSVVGRHVNYTRIGEKLWTCGDCTYQGGQRSPAGGCTALVEKKYKKGTRFNKDSYTALLLIIKGMCCEKGGGCSVVLSGVSTIGKYTVRDARIVVHGRERNDSIFTYSSREPGWF